MWVLPRHTVTSPFVNTPHSAIALGSDRAGCSAGSVHARLADAPTVARRRQSASAKVSGPTLAFTLGELQPMRENLDEQNPDDEFIGLAKVLFNPLAHSPFASFLQRVPRAC